MTKLKRVEIYTSLLTEVNKLYLIIINYTKGRFFQRFICIFNKKIIPCKFKEKIQHIKIHL